MVRFGPHLIDESAIRAVVLLPETVCDPERYSVRLGDVPHSLDVVEGTPAFEDVRGWLNRAEVEAT